MVSGAVELWARKPRVADFEALRVDLDSVRGWWRNRVSRVFLVFFLTSLGTAIGVWIAGFRLVDRLV
jgi:pheromone shutdown protein TraB